jgi:hypothetical protein
MDEAVRGHEHAKADAGEGFHGSPLSSLCHQRAKTWLGSTRGVGQMIENR